MAQREPAGDLHRVIRWLAVLWLVEIWDAVLTYLLVPGTKLLEDGFLDNLLGLRPWNSALPLPPQAGRGVVGVVCAPFLHAGWSHLIGNSLAILLLGLLCLRFNRRLTPLAILYAWVCSGLFTWLVAPPWQIHVGASGIIFGLVGFLLANGIFRRGCLPLLVSALVVFLYGGALTGMVPGMAAAHVSWQMHLGGFIGGLCASWHLRNERP